MSERIKDFQKFVISPDKVVVYLHNTLKEITAKKILENGFNFVSHLDYTTDSFSGKDAVELNYFNLTRKRYGHFTIVLHIGSKIIKEYTEKLKNTKYHYSEALVIGEPIINDDDELIYTLDNQFVKGFINQKTKEIFLNKDFNPLNNKDSFEKNIKRLISNK